MTRDYLLLTYWLVTRSHLLLLAHWYVPQEKTCTAYDAPNSTKAQTTYVTGCKRFTREGKVLAFLQLQLVISVIQNKHGNFLTNIYIIFFKKFQDTGLVGNNKRFILKNDDNLSAIHNFPKAEWKIIEDH